MNNRGQWGCLSLAISGSHPACFNAGSAIYPTLLAVARATYRHRMRLGGSFNTGFLRVSRMPGVPYLPRSVLLE